MARLETILAEKLGKEGVLALMVMIQTAVAEERNRGRYPKAPTRLDVPPVRHQEPMVGWLLVVGAIVLWAVLLFVLLPPR